MMAFPGKRPVRRLTVCGSLSRARRHTGAINRVSQRERRGGPLDARVVEGTRQSVVSRRHRMHVLTLTLVAISIGGVSSPGFAQAPLTWPEIRARFEATNPTVHAGQIGIDESRASEVTAYVRPNPQLTTTLDQIGHNDNGNPFDDALPVVSVSYLHERQDKRELRRDSAQGATAIAVPTQADLVRNLIFTLRTTFVQALQAKAFQTIAQENLTSYDEVLALSRGRLQAGDIAQIDLDRLQLQRVQYEADVETANVNLRTAKIQLLRLLNDGTPIDQFDVTGPFDFAEPGQTLAALRQIALDVRPDLKAASAGLEKAKIDHRLAVANGSVDPTISVDAGFPAISEVWQSYAPPLRQYVGVGISVPIRLFDRNQGEKLRTQLDVTRNEQLMEAARAQVLGDVDSAYATVMSSVALLRPYKETYLDEATRVRDTMTFSYQRGGASLIEFVQAQQEYRTVQISYVNLIAAFLNAVSQLNLAVGQEIIP
jgi:cobalt-zinc-cadmium efflux system outer membrane protein